MLFVSSQKERAMKSAHTVSNTLLAVACVLCLLLLGAMSAKTAESSHRLLWGAFLNDTPLSEFEDMVGASPDMKAVFINWDDPFPFDAAKELHNKQILVIFLEQYDVSLGSIISGEHDQYIKSLAKDAEKYRNPVILAPFHEMNGEWVPWSGVVGNNTPEKVVLAWQHLHITFGEVPNVKFAWVVNNVSVPDTEINAIERYYPGDAYVDYVGVDGFNFGDPWISFDALFSDSLRKLSRYEKPILIASIASATGLEKGSWITDALTVQVKKYPYLQGWIWFNVNKEKDWRVDSDKTSLKAFRKAVE